MVVFFIIWACVMIFCILGTKKANKKKKLIKKEGYEKIFCRAGMGIFEMYCKKDGVLYRIKGGDAKTATPVEVLGITEISNNAKICALDIRCRINGELDMVRVSCGPNFAMRIKEELGFDPS